MIEPILNRLRGTGVLKHFGTLKIMNKEIEIKFVGNHLYGLYLAVVVGILTMNALAGVAVLIAYLAGESYGWGKWVGSLIRWEPIDKELQEAYYNDDEGKHFPFIHYIANVLIKERSNYLLYCRVALAIRGFVWWYPIYVLFAFAGLISYTEALVIGGLLGIGFPVACWIGAKLDYQGKIWIVNYSRGWENQELAYGAMQGIALWYVIFKNLI